MLKVVLELQEQFHVQVQERVAAERERRRKESSAGLELPNFDVGDYVLYARVRRPGVTLELMATPIRSSTSPQMSRMCFSTHSTRGNFRWLVLSASRKQTIVP